MRCACCSWSRPLMTLGISVARVELRMSWSADVVNSYTISTCCRRQSSYLCLVNAVAVGRVREDGVERAGNVTPCCQ